MNTQPTPETGQWETYCDECYYHMWRLRRKTEILRGLAKSPDINKLGSRDNIRATALLNEKRRRDKRRKPGRQCALRYK